MIACMVCSELALAIPLLLYPLWLVFRPFYHRYFNRHGVHGNEHCDCKCHHLEDKDKSHILQTKQPLNDIRCDIHGPDGSE